MLVPGYGRHMRVVVLGAAGQTGRMVVDGLVARGDDVTGVVRSAEKLDELHDAGASTLRADLTELAPTELRALLDGADAVFWAAGAGFGDDPALIDGDACVAAQQAADEAGVGRWVQVSSMYADRPEHGPAFMSAVLAAKGRSDASLAATALGWTVIRPGGLTNDVGTGQVEVGHQLHGGTVSRADLAAVAVACLDVPATARRGFDLASGSTPIETALDGLAVA
jgi:uncharacterized protein YbjT (DUF2867 family)